MKGTIKSIQPSKGFGFIRKNGEKKELYFHWSKTLDDFYYLKAGDEVEFDVDESDERPQAVNVTTIF